MSALEIPTRGYRSVYDWPRDDLSFQDHCEWYEKNLFIIDERDEIVPLRLNDQQKALEYYKWQCYLDGVPCWILILKARKLGCSTWTGASFFRDGITRENSRAYMLSHDDDSSAIIFGMTQGFYEFWEGDKPPLATSSSRELRFAHNGSSFKVRTAGAGGKAGRGGTFSKVHFSELDQYPDPEGLYGAVINSIPESPNVCVVAESTADGPLKMMNTLWDSAIEGRNEFMPFFFPWYETEKYKRVVTWRDIRSYASREWLAKNRQFVDECEAAQLEAMSGGKHVGRVGEPGRGAGVWSPGGNRLQEASGDRSQAEDPGGRTEAGGSGGQEQGERPIGHGRPPEEAEGTGSGTRGHLRSGDEDGEDHTDAGPEPANQFRELSPLDRSRIQWGTGLPTDLLSGGESEDTEGGRGDETFAGEPGATIKLRRFDVATVFKESLNPYETDLVESIPLHIDQINWLRYCLEHRCKGDESRRKREFPTAPEEAFEATGSDVLDARVLAKWQREARENPPLGRGSMRAKINTLTDIIENVYFDSDDKSGKVEIYAYPKLESRYVHAIDPAQGVADGDSHVGCILELETGDQVAEYRSKMDPDLAVEQLELLSLWYNKALTAVEMNGGYGVPFIRHLADRQTLPLYEREQLDRVTRQFTKRPGWLTSVQTRSALFSELKYSVRMEKARIFSMETIKEARTLWQSPSNGKIEARPGHHDDGIMAFGIALMILNYLIGMETKEREKERQARSPMAYFQKQLREKMKEENATKIHKIKTTLPIKKSGVRGVPLRRDGRRSRV